MPDHPHREAARHAHDRGAIRKPTRGRSSSRWRTRRTRSGRRRRARAISTSTRSSRRRKRPAPPAIHPGYGFLSERAEFADACAENGIVFVGPPASAIRAMGLKDAAKALVAARPACRSCRAITARGRSRSSCAARPRDRLSGADQGGCRRRRQGHAPRRAARPISRPRSRARSARRQSAFGDPRVLVEKYVLSPRHVEIQVFADRARQRRASLRARLLAPAPASEGDRGGAGARHDAGDARRRWARPRSRRRGPSAMSAPARSSSSPTAARGCGPTASTSWR